ncbi:Aminobenzoyl-glutamate transport protein [Micrococcus lylae]|uniref:Aminobenzoyl-glutamate transport protein n=1 Tax=Micrococcus lylae TaxID=1273 RepID=A0A1R4INE0_9MICC|nr:MULTISPECIES: AbgT family transporter [Micrococcus]PNL17582.1 aminobenzoyl-glutamate transporter [Micrococcus sp. FDAARGOS_333]WIK82458.1 AbgT family transporter [Micrococcus lylae]SJN21377.1 Aminobenzoyl-glutamate transport protein [Micrococcus lylae]
MAADSAGSRGTTAADAAETVTTQDGSATHASDQNAPDRPRRGGIGNRALDFVEKAGNALPHPATLFAALAVLVVLLSWLFSTLGVTAEDPVEGGQIEVFNLLSPEGVQWMFSSAVDNFVGFAPLGVVLATMLGIGMAEQSGLIGTVLRQFILSVPKFLITAGIVFAGVMSSVASDAGYVVLPPLAAILFMAVGRHPLAGLAAAFAGVSAGFSANLLLSGTDVMLGELTIEAAATVDGAYADGMNLAMNYWFIIASTFLLTIVGTLVSQFIVEPRLGPWKGEGRIEDEDVQLSAVEKKGLVWATVSGVVTVALLALLIVPEWGLLRGEDGGVVQSPFMDSLVVVIIIAFFVPGLVYGIVTKVIRNDTDVVDQLSQTLAGMAVFLVLAFTAGQFIAYFNESKLGLLLSVLGSQFLESINLTGIPLVVAFIAFVSVVNLFVGSASAKWAMLAPIMVPIMMQLGISPEFTQAAYRVADSSTNILSPLMTYFALIIAVAQKYDKKMGIGSLIATMLPYSIAFLVTWSMMTMGWYWLDLPLGPNAPVTYTP